MHWWGQPAQQAFLLVSFIAAVFLGTPAAALAASSGRDPDTKATKITRDTKVTRVPKVDAATKTKTKAVIVIGVAGLRWSDVNQQSTPALWQLVSHSGMASLSLRTAGSLTCTGDGWVSLGAGNRARGLTQSSETCPDKLGSAEPKLSPDGSAQLAEYDKISRGNHHLSYGANPGTLAASVGCVAAVGLPAALGAAHPGGYLDYYAASLPADPTVALRRCPATLISAGVVDRIEPQADLARFDDVVKAVVAARPPNSTIIISGIASTEQPPHLAPLVVAGSGFGKSLLISASTQRVGYTQLIDLAPTIFELLGVGAPGSVVGQPVHVAKQRTASTESSVSALVDADNAAQAPRPWVQPFITVLVVLNVTLLVAAAFFFHRRRCAVEEAQMRLAGTKYASAVADQITVSIPPKRLRWEHVVECAALTLACFPVASFLAQLLPWWRAPFAFAVYALSTLIGVSAIVLAAYRGPWARWPLGPAAFVAVFTAVVLAADVITGSTMQLNSLAGYSPLVAGRFTGFGSLSFAVFAAATLLAGAYLAQLVTGWLRVVMLLTVGMVAVVVVGAPGWGSYVGGVVALTPAVIALTLRGAGVRLSATRIIGCGAAGLLAVAAFATLDYSRPPQDRTHLGRFVQQLSDGTADVEIRRKAEENVHLLFTSSLTLLVLATAAFIVLVAWRRGAGMRRVLGIYPCLRAGLLAVLFASVFGFAANGSGVAVPAFMAMLTMPLLIATTLRVLRT